MEFLLKPLYQKRREIRVLFNKCTPWACNTVPINAYFGHFGYTIVIITPDQVMSQELTKKAYDIVVMGFFGNALPSIYIVDKPIIYLSGERYRVEPILRTGPAIHMMSSRKPDELLKCADENSDVIYTPFICTKTITERKYITPNEERPYWLAYCASNPKDHREQAFCVFYCIAQKINGNGHRCRSLGRCDGGYPQNNFPVPGNHSAEELIDELSKYRYMWCAENADVEGYITEKIMLAYKAGCIPIYWGTIDVKKYFNPASFIYVNDFASVEACAEYIFSLNHKAADKMRNAPIYLDSVKNEPTYEVPTELSLINLCRGNTQAFDSWFKKAKIGYLCNFNIETIFPSI